MIHKGKPRYMGTQSDNFECYIENKSLDAGSKGAKIPLLFSPNSLSDNVAANFNQQSIPGGSAPVITYSGTGARTVSLDFFVPIDYLPPNTDFNNTEEYLNALRALVYPRYIDTTVTPPNCTLHLTNITLDGVCTQCNISYKTDQRYGNDGALGADVSLSFLEVLDKALSNYEVSGRTTILNGTQVGSYQEDVLTNGTTITPTESFSWGKFKLKGNTDVTTRFEKIRTNPQSYLYDQYVPKYNDPGYMTHSGDYSVVKFYYVSPIPLVFSGSDIRGENGTLPSATYKICINGESFPQSNKILQRNQLPELSTQQIFNLMYQGSGIIYYYIIYTPYLGLNNYVFERALIRKIAVIGGV